MMLLMVIALLSVEAASGFNYDLLQGLTNAIEEVVNDGAVMLEDDAELVEKRVYGEYNPTNMCPSHHRYAYYEGQWCCKYNREKYYRQWGSRCDNSAISYASRCCQNDDHFKCPWSRCNNYVHNIGCIKNNGGCDPVTSTCHMTADGRARYCQCRPGYTKVGKPCIDVNECATNNGGCSPHATCTNSRGSFSCRCNGGYSGDGKNCVAINACGTNNGGCHYQATCQNTPGGGSTCTCNSGYTGSGRYCTDLNECSTGNGGCDSNADCINYPGGHLCKCKDGYTGSGTSCKAVSSEHFVTEGTCQKILSMSECMTAASKRGITKVKDIDNDLYPAGCYFRRDLGTNGKAYWNEKEESKSPCTSKRECLCKN